MNTFLRITNPDGLFQFATPSGILLGYQRSKLAHVNWVWRDIQMEGLVPGISFENGSDPYQQFRLAELFLMGCRKAPKINRRVSTQGAKHLIEEIAPEPAYVGQAYVILAARCLGFDVRPTDDHLSYHLNIVADDRYWRQSKLSDWN